MRRDTFPFVLDELQPIRPVVKRVFGFTYVYLDEKLLCALRDSEKKPATNGLWLFTTTEHVDTTSRVRYRYSFILLITSVELV